MRKTLDNSPFPHVIIYANYHKQLSNVCVKISDISDALNIPRPGVTHTFKDMVNGALVLQAAYGAFYLYLNRKEQKAQREIA